MTTDEYWLLKVLFGSLAALSTIVWAWFGVLEAILKRSHIHERLKNFWKNIQDTPILHLPSSAIEWMISREQWVRHTVARITQWQRKIRVSNLLVYFVLHLLGAIVALRQGRTVEFTIIILSWLSNRIYVALLNESPYWEKFIENRMFFTVSKIVPNFHYAVAFWCIFILLELPLWVFMMLMLALFPAISGAFSFLLMSVVDLLNPRYIESRFEAATSAADSFYIDDIFEHFPIVLTSIVFSFFLTSFALLCGALISPDIYLPKTPQMFISNVLCDGISVYLTFKILDLVRFHRAWYTMLPLLLLDAVSAGTLAFLSLFLGLAFTQHSMDLQSVYHVFIGLAPDGQSASLGPYFWVMHTALIPTAIFLAAVLIGWVAKVIILNPVSRFVSRDPAEKHAYALTLALCVFFMAVFSGLGWLFDKMEERSRQEVTSIGVACPGQPLVGKKDRYGCIL